MIITVTLNPALDKTVYIPQFAVDKVNRVGEMRLDPGGKGINVSKVVASLGGRSVAMGILGGGTGQYIKSSLDKLGIDNDFLFIDQDTRTNLKVVDPEGKTYTDINEQGPVVDHTILDALANKLFARICEGDIVVFAGGAPRGVPDDIFCGWTAHCKELGALVYADLDGSLLVETMNAVPHMLKPNDTELERLLGRPMTTMEELAAGARELMARGIEVVIVSLGARGALFAGGGEMMVADNLPVEVHSTVGAGDSMLAAFAWCQSQGMSWQESARWAMATANAKVTEEGSSPPSRDKIEQFYQQISCRSL